jgi:hypothetical protein
MALFRTGRALGDFVLPNHAKLGVDVVEDSKTWPTRVSPSHPFSLWWGKLRWDGFPGNQSCELIMGHLGKRIQVTHLLLNILIGTIKPEASTRPAVNTQWSTNGTPIPAGH